MALDSITSFAGGSGGGVTGYVTLAIWVIVGLLVLSFCAFFLYYFLYKKKNWNLKVEIKIPRSDGKLLNSEWGKGNFNLKRGVVFIKRIGKRPVPMKPFDTEKYLQGNAKGQNILTVMQISPGHYIPLHLDSFLEMEDDKTGEVASLAKVTADYSESRSWKNQVERDFKGAYTIMSLLREYAPYIGVGIIMFMNFAGFAILYSKVT